MADNKSMLDVACEIIEKKGSIAFAPLWNQVAKTLKLTEEEKKKKVAAFYTQLSLDGRFDIYKNKWYLYEKLKFDQSGRDKDMKEAYEEADQELKSTESDDSNDSESDSDSNEDN